MAHSDDSLLLRQMISVAEGCAKPLPMMANCAALLWASLERINWAGFYLLSGNELILGPFQGKPACTVIPLGRGVCGTAAAARKIQLVPDVHRFPGHIACDSASNSEIVIPMLRNGRLYGVLDIDSPEFSRFSAEDEAELSRIVGHLMSFDSWEKGLL